MILHVTTILTETEAVYSRTTVVPRPRRGLRATGKRGLISLQGTQNRRYQAV